jgi:peptide-methionine (S)-S-oxide reductase
MSYFLRKNIEMPSKESAIPGREEALKVDAEHFVNGVSIFPPYPANTKEITVALGCFWGAERLFWSLPGVYATAVGYAGGFTKNPTYDEVCSGMTAHTEVVRVIYDPSILTLGEVLKAFWEGHDPTQGMRQGNDTGTQYRSAIYYSDETELALIQKSASDFQEALGEAGYGVVTTELAPLKEFYFAETYHQQYLAKNPNGYCGLGGTGVSCAVKSAS